MSRPIEEYAIIGDLHAAALVSLGGSIDWLCLPRFDSPACLAALLGDERHGHWQLAPAGEITHIRRRYLPDTLVLETEFATPAGTVRVTDCMPPRQGDPVLVRMVEGIRGTVGLRMSLAARFEYGSSVPHVEGHRSAHGIVAGAESLWLFSPVAVQARQGTATADFRVSRGERVAFTAVWRPARQPAPARPDPVALLRRTAGWWADWVARLSYEGDWRDAVIRSFITVKALSYLPTGGLIAAPTASLPQQPSGPRNWDYRYCWLRDAADALGITVRAGAESEAAGLWDWIRHAVKGPAARAQSLYGVAGERHLPEIELHWLPGHDGAQPVRVGNAATGRPQLGIFGEVMRAQRAARLAGLPQAASPWEPGEVLSLLESRWREPDAGIWEVRGPPHQFVHSKVMVWAAADAAVTMIEHLGGSGPAARWRRLRATVKADVLRHGFDAERNTFVQRYGSPDLDASLLRLPLLGFLPASDPRMAGTVNAIARDLDDSGVLMRYRPRSGSLDGLPPGEGGYLPCGFWLAQCLALVGRTAAARRTFTALLGLRNDVGLLAEEYDPLRMRLAGNHPLTACHLAIIATARALSQAGGPAEAGEPAQAGRGMAMRG